MATDPRPVARAADYVVPDPRGGSVRVCVLLGRRRPVRRMAAALARPGDVTLDLGLGPLRAAVRLRFEP